MTGALRGDEILLDAGAHHGSVAEAFARQTKDAYKGIIAIGTGSRQPGRLVSAINGNNRVRIYDVTLAEVAGEADIPCRARLCLAAFDTGRIRVTTQPIDALGFARPS